jgi:peptidoglycan/xylan/chitin deacetylase (PgdA/CDA1 family)
MNTSRRAHRPGRVLLVLTAVLTLATTGPAAQAAPVPPAQPPPSEVLAADPATVAPPAAGSTLAVGCPPAPEGVRWTAPGTGRTVALTFDDGPGRSTEAILRILAEKQVRATFFDVGINENVRPATVRAIAAQGHLLANHTWSHPDMSRLDAAAQAAEMDDATAQQEAIVGARPCFFRPPYGAYGSTTLNLAHARRMAVYNWSVDTRDWEARGSGATRWVDRIVTRAEAGGRQTHPVVLMHNSPAGNPATVAALPAIIDFYRAAGYTFVDLAGGTAPPDSRVTRATGIGQERARDIRN